MGIKLPGGIDYKRYESTSGMSTKHWGPAYWMFLFTSVLGTYPVRVDWSNSDQVFVVNEFKKTIHALISILPCVFCRESLNFFIAELPLNDFLDSRMEMMYWLYLIKDKVNRKLLRQEDLVLQKQYREISRLYYPGSKEYLAAMQECNNSSFRTVPTPSFKEVLDYYESFRAECVTEAKKCVIKPK